MVFAGGSLEWGTTGYFGAQIYPSALLKAPRAWVESRSNQQNPVYCCWGASGEEENRDMGTSSNTQVPEETPVEAATV